MAAPCNVTRHCDAAREGDSGVTSEKHSERLYRILARSCYATGETRYAVRRLRRYWLTTRRAALTAKQLSQLSAIPALLLCPEAVCHTLKSKCVVSRRLCSRAEGEKGSITRELRAASRGAGNRVLGPLQRRLATLWRTGLLHRLAVRRGLLCTF
jgi:hypothetical protein